MKYKINLNNNIYTIHYENGKIIELARDINHSIIKDNQYIFILLNNSIDKVYDINNKRFITKSLDMKILYNNYKQAKKRNKKKVLSV